jgi:tRNA dimethylallyltransferase
MTQKIHIICGPTGSGKTAYAIGMAHSLAQKNGAVIINADSMQIYKEIPILSAQPSAEEMAQAEHRLYGVTPMAEHSNVTKWLDMAVPEIKQVLESGKTPILVGGTGMYIKSLVEGINPVPEISDEVSFYVRALPLPEAFAELKEKAPISAESLNEGDTQRIQRALMVVLQTGKPIQWWNEQPQIKFFEGTEFNIKYVSPPREKLYDNINKRFLKMVEMGVIDEVREIMKLNINPKNPSYRAHGFRELMWHINGELTLEDAIFLGQQMTRNYAKRQVTWFNHQLKNAEIIIP